MSILVQLEVKAKPECVEEMSSFLADIFPDTRAYDGCIDIQAYLNEDGCTIVFVEHWLSREHYQKYLAWREASGSLAALGPFLQGPPEIRYFQAIDA
tara:strand:+ start:12487 stop:12777 length:291 start_codon:yes stop_codon:yes gene_type:complete